MFIVNNRRQTTIGEYVGRPSPLGNPYRIGPDGPRDRVIALYKEWLWDKIVSEDRAVIDELVRLRNIHRETGELQLLCWCSPEACHADVIVACLQWMETADFEAKRR